MTERRQARRQPSLSSGVDGVGGEGGGGGVGGRKYETGRYDETLIKREVDGGG